MDNTTKSGINLPVPAFSIITAFVVLMILGIAVIPLMSVQLHSSQNLKSLTINFSWPAAPAELLEQEVTIKIEGLANTVNGVTSIKSVTSKGSGTIKVSFGKKTDIDQAKYEITTLIRQIYDELPPGVSYPDVSVNYPQGEGNRSILYYTISGDISASDIEHYATKYIKPQLAVIDGVYDVNIYGASAKAWAIKYKPADIKHYNISEDDIQSKIKAYSVKYEFGEIALLNDQKRSGLVLQLSDTGAVNLSNIAVKNIGTKTIYLADVADIELQEQEPGSSYRINGLTTIDLNIVAEKNVNYVTLANKIKKQVQIVHSKLPSHLSLRLAYDASKELKTELDTTIWRLIITLGVLFIFVLLISRELKYLLIIIISLICNLLISFVLYYLFNLEIQLYSLAGITASIGMMVDNSIVIIDHIRYKNNMRVFLALAGATLVSIGSVCVVFFLNESQRVKLVDFAWVMIINLLVSLVIAFCFIPALMEKLPLSNTRLAVSIRKKRRIVDFNRFYQRLITFGLRYKPYFIISAILLFGLPVFLLPAKIEKNNGWALIYNKSIGSEFYNTSVRPYADKFLGGSLRMFISSPEKFRYTDGAINNRTRLHIEIHMPKGIDFQKMDHVVQDFERYLSQFNEIYEFQSRIYGGEEAEINVFIKKEFNKNAFPAHLKNQLENKAIYTGLAEFDITGVGDGFNNEIEEESTSYGLMLFGYNYQNLYRFAEQVKNLLKKDPRITGITISSERDKTGDKTTNEYVFNINSPEKLLINHISPQIIKSAFFEFSANKTNVGNIFTDGRYLPIVLVPTNSRASVWQIMNEAISSDSGSFVRLKQLSTLKKEKTDSRIIRDNQQYQLALNYNYIGYPVLGNLVSENVIKQVQAELPLGYTVRSETGFWQGAAKTLMWTIIFTVIVVFVLCSILLNSLVQPLAVIVMIPLSFIGVFLMSSFFGYRFDEGGYVAFVVLCGIVVSAALYILNDYNNLIIDHPCKTKKSLFIKAYSSKIIPVILSRLSILISLLPFIIFSRHEPFWYALAMSITGGLCFSMIAIIVFLPLFINGMNKKRKEVDFTIQPKVLHGIDFFNELNPNKTNQ